MVFFRIALLFTLLNLQVLRLYVRKYMSVYGNCFNCILIESSAAHITALDLLSMSESVGTCQIGEVLVKGFLSKCVYSTYYYISRLCNRNHPLHHAAMIKQEKNGLKLAARNRGI